MALARHHLLNLPGSRQSMLIRRVTVITAWKQGCEGVASHPGDKTSLGIDALGQRSEDRTHHLGHDLGAVSAKIHQRIGDG